MVPRFGRTLLGGQAPRDPRFGATGVAASMAGGTILQNLLLWVAARRRVGIWTHAAIPRRGDLATLLARGRED